MNRIIAYLFVALAFWSCQKGEDDPFLSLKTRKARLVGEWKLDSYSYSNSDGLLSQANWSDGEMTYLNVDSTELKTEFNWTITFDTEGKYESEQVEKFDADTVAGTEEYTETRIEKGEWQFSGGNSTKRKSALLLVLEEEQKTRSDQGSNVDLVTYSGLNTGALYQLNRLSKEDLWMSYSIETNFAFGSVTEELTVKFKKKGS